MSDPVAAIPLFKGATRLPTFLGVPRMMFLGTLIFCGFLFMYIHIWALGIFAFLWFVEWSVTKHDDRAFHILYLATKTKGVGWIESRTKGRFGGSSYATGPTKGKI